MAAATCQAQVGTGSSVSWANAEGGIKFNRIDNATALTDPTPIPPSGPATNYSWLKYLVLAVTLAGTTSITNRRVSWNGSLPTGMSLSYKAMTVASYAQAVVGNMPAAAVSDGAVPATYTALTNTPVQYDNASVATSGTGPNGQMLATVLGVASTFVGGPSNNSPLPSIVITYDEA